MKASSAVGGVVVVVVVMVVVGVVVSIASPQAISFVDQVVSPALFLVAETSAVDLLDGVGLLLLLLSDSGLDG